MSKRILKQLIAMGLFCSCVCADAEAFKVSIIKVVEHEAINAVVEGIKDELKGRGVKYDIETCQADPALAYQIATKFVNDKTDVIVAVGTTPAQCAFGFAKLGKPKAKLGQAKLVFSSVTEPTDIAKSFANCNTTGVSNFVSLKPQLELFKKLQPKLKKLGIIYNSGESNSISIIKKLEKECAVQGITLVKQSIQQSADIPQAITKLKTNVDAVFITNDNTALSGIPCIVQACDKVKIPVYVSDTDQVAKGCLAALGPNQYEIGRQTGRIIKRIQNGENINEISVEYPDTMELFLNKEKAKELDITVPADILKEAKCPDGKK